MQAAESSESAVHAEREPSFLLAKPEKALLRWIGALKQPPRHLFLTHGEEDAARHFQSEIERQLGWPASVPAYGDSVDL